MIALIGLVFLLAWEFGPGLLAIPPYIIPSLSECAVEMVRLYQQEQLLSHLASTFMLAAIGFFIGSVMGAGIGYLLGTSERLERLLSPYILAVQIAPKVAFTPLLIIWFGYGVWPKLVVTILVVFFPILVNVLQAMKTVDRDLVNLARAYNMGRMKIFLNVMLPSSMPSLMAGLRIGATLAIIGIAVGELVGGSTGLGYLVTYGQGQGNTAMVFNAILLLTLIGILMYALVTALEGKVLHYMPKLRSDT